MKSKKLVNLLIEWWSSLEEIMLYTQAVALLMSRAKSYQEIVSLAASIQSEELPVLQEFIDVLDSVDLLNESWKNMLLRECESRTTATVVKTSSDDVANEIDADQIQHTDTIWLHVTQWQRIYKRSLMWDLGKLLK